MGVEHNYEAVQLADGETVLFCRKCGKSYRFVIYTSTVTTPSRAAWEEMRFENPDGEQIVTYSCMNGS